MRKIYYMTVAVTLATIAGCQEEDKLLNVQSNINQTFYATVENGVDTRTALTGDKNDVIWSEGDQISVFKETTNYPFILKKGEETTSGTFVVNPEGTESNGSSSTLSTNLAYYPYDSKVTVSENEGTYTFNATFPTTQTYSRSGTFGKDASPMVAVTSNTSDNNLMFKNVGAIFRLQLKGNAIIKKIEFSANANLAGDCKITASHENGNTTDPTVSVIEGSKAITLDCGNGVQLSDNPTHFIVAMLPVENVTGGITITIYDDAGYKMVYTHKADEEFDIVRSNAYTTEELTYSATEDLSSPFSGGTGSKDNPYLIGEAAQLSSISDYYNTYTYFKIADGVETLDLTGIGKLNLNGSFDGNGVEITGLTTCLFENVGDINKKQNIKISNFTATVHTTDGRALVKNIINPGETTFENVTLHGYIEGQYNIGSFYNYGTANNSIQPSESKGANYTVNFKNTTSDATLVCTTGNAIGGMLGHGYQGNSFTLSINMDDKSGYSGQMYTTGTATCYKVMAMCSSTNYILNGNEISRYIDTYPSTKITEAAPTMEEDGYYVDPVNDVDHYIVYLNCQLTAYDEDGNKINNLAGMTWNLGSKTITSDFENKIFDIVNSASIENGSDKEFGYQLEKGVLKVFSGRDVNYASGWITLQVNQYATDGTLLATGNITVHTFDEPKP